ncbi:MAG TPA: YybS family protein [Patescibacteria group bacterium]|nr:YybS family protein [Patescibacteria group bacterium]
MTYSPHRVKPMVEGGILTAVAILFALVSTYVPLIGAFVNLIWPVPIILLGVRHGYRWSMLAAVASGFLIALLMHPLHAVTVVVGFGLIGIVLGHAFRKEWSPARALMAGTAASLISKVAVLGIAVAVLGINPLNQQADAMSRAMAQVMEMYRSMGIKEADLAQIETMMRATLELMKVIFPAGLAMAALLDTCLNYWAAKVVLRKLGHSIPNLPSFSRWVLPRAVIYALAVAMVMIYWGNSRQLEFLSGAGVNLMMLSSVALLVQGLSLFSFFADKYSLSRWVRGILLFLILTSGPISQGLIIAGAFELIFDYRRLRKPPVE